HSYHGTACGDTADGYRHKKNGLRGEGDPKTFTVVGSQLTECPRNQHAAKGDNQMSAHSTGASLTALTLELMTPQLRRPAAFSAAEIPQLTLAGVAM
ncbi:hypothetical protein BaRGS_00038114, partial [Batillaria attramentaria]